MKPNKQIIAAIILAPVVVLIVAGYSLLADALLDSLLKAFYVELATNNPIIWLWHILSKVNVLILDIIIALPVFFATKKFGVKPLHIIGSTLIIYVLYAVVPLLPVLYTRVYTNGLIVTKMGVDTWQRAVAVSLSFGVIMFATCLIITKISEKRIKKAEQPENSAEDEI